ncbi:MAG: family 20 glycosylhydrolase [Acidimicrobiia bacterium]|nr:family 20 glycosylhydrolase [Acidimicrobiia bacterium]
MFERRAYMLDVSRDRVPTRETLEWLVGALAALGFNELQLYVEHTFAYAGHQEVWEGASAFTSGDLRWLDYYCETNGVELVGNMNCFGHMERWLVHERYRSLAECPNGAPALFGSGTMRPGCLAPTAENAALGVTLARELAGVLRSRRIHIGGDEPFELGEGASAPDTAERGRETVYIEHLSRIIEPLADDGYQVMFWADQFRRDRSLVSRIPAGAIPVVWNYEAPSQGGWQSFLPPELADRLGLPDDPHLGFEAHARLFIETGRPFWVAPGTSSWNTFIGRNLNAAANIADAAAVGAAWGAPGFLLTDWGDNGHHQPLPVSLPSMVRGGAAAMGESLGDDAAVAGRVDDLLGCEPGVGALIDRLGRIGEGLGMVSLNSSPIFTSLCSTGFPGVGEPDPEAVSDGLGTLAEAREWFSQPIGGLRGTVVAAELEAACHLAELGLRRLGAEFGLEVEAPTGSEIDEAASAQRRAWLLSSQPGGLEDSIGKLIR